MKEILTVNVLSIGALFRFLCVKFLLKMWSHAEFSVSADLVQYTVYAYFAMEYGMVLLLASVI